MIDVILQLLNKKGIDKYLIRDEIRESYEMFFIKKNVDLTRKKKVKEITVTVYKDFEENGKKLTGNANFYVYPFDTEETIEKAIDEAYASAGYVKNAYYPLPQSSKAVVTYDRSLSNGSLTDNAIKMAQALYSADNREDAFINSAEFFANKETVRILSSAGADCTYDQFTIKGEYVTQSLLNGQDVELYNSFEYDELDCDSLRKACEEALSCTADRAVAEKAPLDLSGVPIILSGQNLNSFYSFFGTRAHAAMIYPHYSDYEVGMDVCANLSTGKPDIDLLSTKPFSSDGVKLGEIELLKNGVLKNIHGDSKCMYYLGKEPIGAFDKARVNNSGVSSEELKKTPYIHVKYFSDFQMDEMDGHFGGEFRLAYYYDGDKEHIITGGTVSGNILTANKLEYSNTKYTNSTYEGPDMVKIS